MKRSITTKAKFAQWLRRQPKHKEFLVADSCMCPLAQYVGGDVLTDEYRRDGGERWIYLPKWARAFIVRFDRAKDGSKRGAIAALATRAQ